MQERSLVLIKPDGVKKALIGEIIKRFEDRSLKIIALQLVNPTRKQMDLHYPTDKDYIINLGNNTLKCYKEFNLPTTPEEDYGTSDPHEIGLKVREWLLDFMTSGPIVKMIVEGLHAIKTIRKIIGVTIPAFAEPGSIRGDFSIDSPDYANLKKRAIKNLIHASGNQEEAAQEIALWFSPEDLHEYKTMHDLMEEL